MFLSERATLAHPGALVTLLGFGLRRDLTPDDAESSDNEGFRYNTSVVMAIATVRHTKYTVRMTLESQIVRMFRRYMEACKSVDRG